MRTIKVEIIVEVRDDSRIENADVVDAVNEALTYDANNDDQSLWNFHEYDVEIKE